MLTALTLIAGGIGCILLSKALVRLADRTVDKTLDFMIEVIEIAMIYREIDSAEMLAEYESEDAVVAENMLDGYEHSTCNCRLCAPHRTIH